MVYRGLEGFVVALASFNFTAIGGNLSTAPALIGNVILWKPSSAAVLSRYIVFKILREAGLPPSVINFVPSISEFLGDLTTCHPDLTGINFTGSVPTFRRLWKQVSTNIDKLKTFPRLVEECGGKNFPFVHESVDVDSIVFGTISAAFEYSGQKCSACSRLYVPRSLWSEIKKKLMDVHNKLKVGQEIFGPVLCVYVYRMIGAKKFSFIKKASNVLWESTGNFYINDKCTGSVVGKQPFGCAGLSGTNDKAGSPHYILQWSSPLTISNQTVEGMALR